MFSICQFLTFIRQIERRILHIKLTGPEIKKHITSVYSRFAIFFCLFSRHDLLDKVDLRQLCLDIKITFCESQTIDTKSGHGLSINIHYDD